MSPILSVTCRVLPRRAACGTHELDDLAQAGVVAEHRLEVVQVPPGQLAPAARAERVGVDPVRGQVGAAGGDPDELGLARRVHTDLPWSDPARRASGTGAEATASAP